MQKLMYDVDSVEVLATLTSDVGRILSKLHQVQPDGNINLLTGIRIAHVRKFLNNMVYSKILDCKNYLKYRVIKAFKI